MTGKITIISGTNRENSYTEKVAKFYEAEIKAMGKEVLFLDLKQFPEIIGLNDIYSKAKSDKFNSFVNEYITGSDAFVFIVPEYNGSFPGIVKVFLDAVHPSHWANKKVCLTGVSTGRAGNLRGMEHLTGVLLYLKLHIFHNRLPISMIDKILTEGNSLPAETRSVIHTQLEGFLRF
jgi:NAD(P)H-dependent FMN reductase